ncbi:MAG: hypothetical protein Q4G39_03635 [Brachymonas sp.]|nr:hypothetical protein [Brachymonas sp.]
MDDHNYKKAPPMQAAAKWVVVGLLAFVMSVPIWWFFYCFVLLQLLMDGEQKLSCGAACLDRNGLQIGNLVHLHAVRSFPFAQGMIWHHGSAPDHRPHWPHQRT